jgi:hypothetical protein
MHMDGESHWRRLRPAAGARPRARLAAWNIAVGIALILATAAVSALNAISTQQAIAMALPAVLIALGGIVGWVVPDAWIAWRRGFRRGCETAGLASQPYLPRAGSAGNQLRAGRLAKLTTYPGPRRCALCERTLSRGTRRYAQVLARAPYPPMLRMPRGEAGVAVCDLQGRAGTRPHDGGDPPVAERQDGKRKGPVWP